MENYAQQKCNNLSSFASLSQAQTRIANTSSVIGDQLQLTTENEFEKDLDIYYKTGKNNKIRRNSKQHSFNDLIKGRSTLTANIKSPQNNRHLHKMLV